MAVRGRGWLAVAVVAALAACSSQPSASLETMFEKAAHDVLPGSIVQIDADGSIGSGVVFDRHGDIVTNAHVVSGLHEVEVLLNAKARALPARVIGVSTASDLAVVRVLRGTEALSPAHFGNSDQLQIGQFVLAMGDPLGLTDSVTEGIVSSAERQVKEQGTGAVLTVIQTSAAINPGNSGGGLVDVNGNVVGVPTLNVYDPKQGSTAPGIGFAIPSNTVRRVAAQLIADARPA